MHQTSVDKTKNQPTFNQHLSGKIVTRYHKN